MATTIINPPFLFVDRDVPCVLAATFLWHTVLRREIFSIIMSTTKSTNDELSTTKPTIRETVLERLFLLLPMPTTASGDDRRLLDQVLEQPAGSFAVEACTSSCQAGSLSLNITRADVAIH